MFVARLNRFSGFGAFSGQVPQQFPRMETVRCSANPLESSGMHPENTSAPSDMQRMRFPNLKAGAGLWGGRLGASDTPAFLITQGRFQEWKQPDADFSWQKEREDIHFVLATRTHQNTPEQAMYKTPEQEKQESRGTHWRRLARGCRGAWGAFGCPLGDFKIPPERQNAAWRMQFDYWHARRCWHRLRRWRRWGST